MLKVTSTSIGTWLLVILLACQSESVADAASVALEAKIKHLHAEVIRKRSWNLTPAEKRISHSLRKFVERFSAMGITPENARAHGLAKFSNPLVRVDARGRLQVYEKENNYDDPQFNL